MTERTQPGVGFSEDYSPLAGLCPSLCPARVSAGRPHTHTGPLGVHVARLRLLRAARGVRAPAEAPLAQAEPLPRGKGPALSWFLSGSHASTRLEFPPSVPPANRKQGALATDSQTPARAEPAAPSCRETPNRMRSDAGDLGAVPGRVARCHNIE